MKNKYDIPEDTKWKQIEEFPTYWISDKGHVINLKSGYLLALVSSTPNGAKHVTLWNGYQACHRSIKNLVWKYFRVRISK